MNSEKLEKEISALKAENTRLKTGIEELSILNEIAVAIGSTLSVDKMIELIVNKCVKHFNVEQGAVMLLDLNPDSSPFQTMVRKADMSSYALPYRMNSQITGWMIKNKKSLIVNDLKNDDRFNINSGESQPVNSILSVPLMLKGTMIGLLCLFNKKDNMGFPDEERRLLTIISSESAQIIENARLLEEEQNYLRMREEVRMAANIQENLLPKEIPDLDNYDIAATNIAASQVSGDYYDFMNISDTLTAFCVGDVSGKGMPAALLMANLQATLRGQALFNSSPKDCICVANTLLYNSTGQDKFVTLFYGTLNTKNNNLTLCNAGHDAPLLLNQEGKIETLDTGGLVLGFIAKCEYEEEVRKILPGEVLVIYSDGITEAMNENEMEFGEDPLRSLLVESKDLSAVDIIEKITSSVKTHVNGHPQSDDMTLMVIKRVK